MAGNVGWREFTHFGIRGHWMSGAPPILIRTPFNLGSTLAFHSGHRQHNSICVRQGCHSHCSDRNFMPRRSVSGRRHCRRRLALGVGSKVSSSYQGHPEKVSYLPHSTTEHLNRVLPGSSGEILWNGSSPDVI